MPASVGLCLLAQVTRSGRLAETRGLPVGTKASRENRKKMVRRSLRAGAHTDASSKTSPGNKTGGTKAPTPKNHAKAAASGSSASSSSAAKAHPVSHPAANKHPKSNAAITARNSKSTHAISRKNSKRRTTARGQQKIEPERAQAIQEALIREHYMSGEPTGTWNQDSEDC